jgi:hypothetical protein
MDDRRPDDAMTDAALERDIERALAVEPSPEFLARVRAEIDAQPERTPWRIAWTWLAVGSAVAAITAAIVLSRPAAPQPRNVLEPAPVATTTTAKTAPAKPAATPQASLAQTLGSHMRDVPRGRLPSLTSVAQRTPRPEPEVLIAQDEAVALRRLMRGLDRGVVEPSVASDGPSGVQPIQPPIPIVVAPMAAVSPITIEPLGIPAPEGGVRQ